jgi:8-oxo-dGTP pyrophosphatase MutT (NUDIX family)
VDVVRAGGGVVVCRPDEGGPRVLLVHRPRYDDWTLPKGKAEPDEPDEAAALREVEEETGLRCTLEEELPATEYVDAKGRPKVVRYWRMRADGSGRTFEPTAEIDEIRWATAAEAEELLSYERDVAVVRAALE